MSKKATDIIAYLTPLGFIIAFLAGDRENSRFHLNQALVILICELIVEALDRIFDHIPLVGWIGNILCVVLAIAVVVCWIMGLAGAISGTEKPVPVLGGVKLL